MRRGGPGERAFLAPVTVGAVGVFSFNIAGAPFWPVGDWRLAANLCFVWMLVVIAGGGALSLALRRDPTLRPRIESRLDRLLRFARR